MVSVIVQAVGNIEKEDSVDVPISPSVVSDDHPVKNNNFEITTDKSSHLAATMNNESIHLIITRIEYLEAKISLMCNDVNNGLPGFFIKLLRLASSSVIKTHASAYWRVALSHEVY